MRLFAAVWPPHQVVQDLAALERPQWPGLRWTPAAQWHVTLRFFGEVDVDQGVDAGAGLARAARNAGPVVAEMGPVLGRIGRNVLQVPVAGLDDVAGAIISSTAEIGQAPGPRGFSGHITLARNRGKTPLSELAGAPVIGRWEVEEVSLVASLASPHPGVPNRYEVVATFPLG